MRQQYEVADMPFIFVLLRLSSKKHSAKYIHDCVKAGLSVVPKGRWFNWVVGNHDKSRISGRVGTRYVNAINALLLLLPGTPTVYYGDEIGMLNVDVSFEETKDTNALKYGKVSEVFCSSYLLPDYVVGKYKLKILLHILDHGSLTSYKTIH